MPVASLIHNLKQHLKMSARILAARSRVRALRLASPPHHVEGAGKAGRWPRPWPACSKKSRRQSPQVWPKTPGPPCANGFNGLYVISPGTGCLAPVVRALVATYRLGASTGTPGPHDFAVRIGAFVGEVITPLRASASIAFRSQRP